MVPMIIKSIPILKAVLKNVPDVSWIPSDVCADVVLDLVLGSLPDTLRILHVANPCVVSWKEVTDIISSILGIPKLPLLSASDYIECVEAHGRSVPIYRLIPYFQFTANHGGFPNAYCSLDVQKTLQISKALRDCPKVDRQLLSPIVHVLLNAETEGSSAAQLTSQSAILLFGPWANKSQYEAEATAADTLNEKRLLGLAVDARRMINYPQPK